MKAVTVPSPYGASSSSCHHYNNYRVVIIMAKSKKSQPASSPNKGSEPAAPRITSNVKQNLQFLKLWKEFQKKKSSTPRPSTSYRRKKVEKEDLPDDTELYRDPTLSLYYTNQIVDTGVPVLLVDGYNVCGYWAKLKKHFMNGRLDIARQKLINELVAFSMARDVKVVVVFDAMMSGLPTHKENFTGVDIIFTGESCADAWIEKEVVALKEDGCPKVWVVTSDHIHQHAAYGAGAFIWSCKALVSEIKASQEEVERALQELRPTSFQGRLLKHNLDSEVVDALKDLRNKLAENELKSRKGVTVLVRKSKVKWWDAFRKEYQCALPAVEGWFKSNRLLPSSHQSQQSHFLAQKAKTTALLASAQTREEYFQILQSLAPKRDNKFVSSNSGSTGSASSVSLVISLGNDNEDNCFGILSPVKH